jgi:hypothetical protein
MILKFLKEYLVIKTQVTHSSSLLKRLPKDASLKSDLMGIRQKVGGKILYKGVVVQNNIDATTFKEACIGFIYQ